MRPEVLRVEGLRSYLDMQTIDFRDRDLMAIIGDTGAGKSSLLEAICFALYGSSSWNNKAVKELISHGRDVMRVELSFRVGGARWTITRSAARGAHPRPITKLESEDGQVKLDKKRDVDAMVQKLLGLDYHTFLRSVILPQGRFQQLLQATAADRARILKGIFRLDLLESVRSWSDEWRRARDPQLRSLEQARARLLPDPAAQAQAASERVAELERADAACAGVREGAATDTQRAEELAGAVAAVERKTAALGSADIDQARGALDRIERDAQALAEEERRLAQRLAKVERERAALGASRQAAAARGLDAASLIAAADRLDRAMKRRELEAEAKELARTAGALETERQAVLDARVKARGDAESGLERARAALDQAQRADMASHLAAHLEPGDPCPVCGQDVETRPKAGKKAAGLRRAETGVARAEKAAKAALDAERRAERELTEAHEARERSAGAALDAAREVAALIAEIPAALAPADTGQDALQEAAHKVAAQRQELRQVEDQLGEIDKRANQLRLDQSELAARRSRDIANPAQRVADQLDARARALSDLATALGTGAPAELESAPRAEIDLAGMRSRLDALERASQRLCADAERRIREHQAERASLLERARTSLGTVECQTLSELDQRLGELRAEARRARADHDQARAQIAPAAELDQRIQAAQTLLLSVEEMRRLLADGKFVSYAVERKQEALLTVASQLMSDMTDGRYGFAADFQIVDKRAGEVRSTETLSGGETFLASLSLALALVELAGRTGVHLDALFLDEGFGSLDADALEQAVQALSMQAARGRLVVVISHLQAVAENIEHVLLVESTPMGSRAHELGAGERARFDLDAARLLA